MSWSGIVSPSANDWIGLYNSGASDSSVLVSRYTTGTASGSVPLTIPASLTPGTYDLRLYANNSYTRLATSTVTVQFATFSSSPSTVNPGGTTTVSWSGIVSPSSNDWIGLYNSGAADGSSVLVSRYTTGTASGSVHLTIPASLTPGTYDLRLYANNSYTRLATSTVTVQYAATLSSSPSPVNPGGTLTVSWSGIVSPSSNDWIGVYSSGAADGSSVLVSRYTTGTASGSVPLTIPASLTPGTYDLRLYANNSFTRLATSTVTVQFATFSSSPSTVNPGGTTTVSWSGIVSPSANDWIGVYSSGAADGAPSILASRYTTGTASGSVPLMLPASLTPGTYDLRLYANNSYTRLATSTVTVQFATFSASPSTVNPGGTTTVSWSGIVSPTATDWIALYNSGAADGGGNVLVSRYTTGTASGSVTLTIPASLTPGTYDLRLYANNSFTRLATSTLTVQ